MSIPLLLEASTSAEGFADEALGFLGQLGLGMLLLLAVVLGVVWMARARTRRRPHAREGHGPPAPPSEVPGSG